MPPLRDSPQPCISTHLSLHIREQLVPDEPHEAPERPLRPVHPDADEHEGCQLVQPTGVLEVGAVPENSVHDAAQGFGALQGNTVVVGEGGNGGAYRAAMPTTKNRICCTCRGFRTFPVCRIAFFVKQGARSTTPSSTSIMVLSSMMPSMVEDRL